MFMLRQVSMNTGLSVTRDIMLVLNCFAHKSLTEFTLRFVQNDVPLKTIDGGSTWVPLSNTPTKVGKLGNTNKRNIGFLSWSGKTLVVHGADLSAIGRQERVSILLCLQSLLKSLFLG
jgi:hypothetical protein